MLDEPTANLADSNVGQLFNLIGRVQAAGFGVLYVSHDLDEIASLTDRVTVVLSALVRRTESREPDIATEAS